jgi:hypothetical protein
VGTDDGISVVYLQDNDWKSFTTGTEYFADGNIGIAGSFSIADVQALKDESVAATGLTGPYAGKVGTMRFHAVDLSSPYTPVYAMSITVCG